MEAAKSVVRVLRWVRDNPLEAWRALEAASVRKSAPDDVMRWVLQQRQRAASVPAPRVHPHSFN